MKKNVIISTSIIFLILLTSCYALGQAEIQATVKLSSSGNNCVDVYVRPSVDINSRPLNIFVSLSIPNHDPDNPDVVSSNILTGLEDYSHNSWIRGSARWQVDVNLTEVGNAPHVNWLANQEYLIGTYCFVNGPYGVAEEVQMNHLQSGGQGYTYWYIQMYDGNHNGDLTNNNEPFYSTTGGSVNNGNPTSNDDAFAETSQPVFLPIELLSFEARCDQGVIKLDWVTASEINNDYFNVERSVDGYHWMEIATIDGAGSSSTVQEYSYTDNPYIIRNFNHAFYYRLKQTDFDGTDEYSDIVLVSCDGRETPLIQVQPIPNTGTFVVKGLERNAELVILNMYGIRIYAATATSISAWIHLEAPAGMYYLVVKSDSGTNTKKIVISR